MLSKNVCGVVLTIKIGVQSFAPRLSRAPALPIALSLPDRATLYLTAALHRGARAQTDLSTISPIHEGALTQKKNFRAITIVNLLCV